MCNNLQMEQRFERGAGPDCEATEGEAALTGSGPCWELAGICCGGWDNAGDGIVGCEDAGVTGHYDVEDRNAGRRRGVMGGAETLLLVVANDAGVEEGGMRAAGVSAVRDGGGLRA